jgi:hypothetical protein
MNQQQTQQNSVTLLSTLRQFNKDFSEKAAEQDLDQADDINSQKLETTEELLALAYLSYLE